MVICVIAVVPGGVAVERRRVPVESEARVKTVSDVTLEVLSSLFLLVRVKASDTALRVADEGPSRLTWSGAVPCTTPKLAVAAPLLATVTETV